MKKLNRMWKLLVEWVIFCLVIETTEDDEILPHALLWICAVLVVVGQILYQTYLNLTQQMERTFSPLSLFMIISCSAYLISNQLHALTVWRSVGKNEKGESDGSL